MSHPDLGDPEVNTRIQHTIEMQKHEQTMRDAAKKEPAQEEPAQAVMPATVSREDLLVMQLELTRADVQGLQLEAAQRTLQDAQASRDRQQERLAAVVKEIAARYAFSWETDRIDKVTGTIHRGAAAQTALAPGLAGMRRS